MEAVNGEYIYHKDRGGTPSYRNGDIVLMRYTINRAKYWYLVNIKDTKSGKFDYYRVRSDADTPPVEGWGCEGCQASLSPAPTIREMNSNPQHSALQHKKKRHPPAVKVGDWLNVWWAGEKVWFSGVVISIDISLNKHTVQYIDNDVLAHDLSSEIFEVFHSRSKCIQASQLLAAPDGGDVERVQLVQPVADKATKEGGGSKVATKKRLRDQGASEVDLPEVIPGDIVNGSALQEVPTGTRFNKHFAGLGTFEGRVEEYNQKEGTYMVVYDADGTFEDIKTKALLQLVALDQDGSTPQSRFETPVRGLPVAAAPLTARQAAVAKASDEAKEQQQVATNHRASTQARQIVAVESVGKKQVKLGSSKIFDILRDQIAVWYQLHPHLAATTPIKHWPTICYAPLDLAKLWLLVDARGGYEAVCNDCAYTVEDSCGGHEPWSEGVLLIIELKGCNDWWFRVGEFARTAGHPWPGGTPLAEAQA